MKGAIFCGVIMGFAQVITPAQFGPSATTDTPRIKEDTIISAQLNSMQEEKGQPLTLTDTIKAVSGRYGFTVDRARRDLQKHNDNAEELIKTLDSLIKSE